MDITRLNHLEELKGSDFEIAEGMPDIQGWKIVDISGEKIGKVKDMLFDKEARKVRYIITTVNSDVDGLDDRDVLIPIGQAELDITDEEVKIPTHTLAQLSGLPSYTRGEITPEHEYAIRNTFLGSITGEVGSGRMDTPYNRETFYNDENFDEGRFYNKEGYSERSGKTNRRGGINTVENLDRADDIDRAESLDRPVNSEIADRFEDDIDLARNKGRDEEDPFGREANDPNRI